MTDIAIGDIVYPDDIGIKMRVTDIKRFDEDAAYLVPLYAGEPIDAGWWLLRECQNMGEGKGKR